MAYGCMGNSSADKPWYWPAGQHCYYYYLPQAVARQRWVNPAPALDGRPLNPSAHPFVPKEVNPKPSGVDKEITLPSTSRVYFTPLPVYHPLLHQPPALSYCPPQPPVLCLDTREAVTLRDSGGKSVSLRPKTKRKRAMWKPKLGCNNNSTAARVTDLDNGGAGNDSAKDTQTFTPDQVADDADSHGGLHGSTTLMIRNIPNSLKREDLMKILDQHCCRENKTLMDRDQLADGCRSEYDFVYLPMDYRTQANKGYAFVNFTSSDGAKRMWMAYHRFKWECYRNPSRKVCEICPAILQGKDELLRSLRNRAFPKEQYQPVMAESSPRDGFNDAPFLPIGFSKQVQVTADD